MTLNKTISTNINYWLSVEHYQDILLTAKEDESKSVPPVNPKAGDIYLYCNKHNREDWKSDQIRWRQKGTKHLPKHRPILTCHYYDGYDFSGLQRRAYVLYEKDKKYSDFTVIHYVGKVDFVPPKSVHGNSKQNKKTHIMTTKSQLQKQKDMLKEKPKDVYRKLVCENSSHPLLAPVAEPKNPKQVANAIATEQRKRLLSDDDVLGLYALHLELDGFIKKLELVPHFVTVLCSSKMIALCQQSCVGKLSPVFYYDTTFDLGDFYVSPLVFSNSFFENGPCIPLAYGIHDTKFATVHMSIFQTVLSVFPEIVGKPIVTDREESIKKAISKVLPENPHVFCWNHIQQDVKNWLKRHLVEKSSDYKVLINNVWDLMDSDSVENYQSKYDDMSVHWSCEFKTYFDKHLAEDVCSSGKWILQSLELYSVRSGITINPSESFNALLKRFLNRSEVRLQVLALSLFQLDKYYQKEILRGMCGLGEFTLKENIKNQCLMKLEDVQFPEGMISLDKLPYVFENKDFSIQRQSEMPFTNYGVAKMLVLQGRVRHVPEEQAFIVSGDEQKNLVRLFPTEKCTCKVKQNCHHITAVKLSIGNEIKSNKTVKLQTIVKKSRGFKSGKKFAPKSANEVLPADDSELANMSIDMPNSNINLTAMSIPTAATGSKAVKRRFVLTEKHSKTLQNLEDLEHSVLSKNEIDDKLEITPQASSTPKRVKPNQSTSDDNFDSLITDTFTTNFQKDKMFKVFGKCIYPSEIDSLVNIVGKTTLEKYTSESVLSVYISIVDYEARKKNASVTTFISENILNISQNPEALFLYALEEFIKHKIPEKDLVFFPLVHAGHCSLIVVLRKQNLILYLDSLHLRPPQSILATLLKLYKNYYGFQGEEFSQNFQIFAPTDIPLQFNTYDCGIYVCMFAEVILQHSLDCLAGHKNNDMYSYRTTIHEKLVEHMKKSKNTIVPKTARAYSKKNFEKYVITEFKSLNLNITRSAPSEEPTLKYMAKIVDNYWDDTSSVCHHNQCANPMGALVHCYMCEHWYHVECIGFDLKKQPKRYICDHCKDS